MATIFVSYRRDDSKGSVGRLYDCLVKYFDRKEILIDAYTIRPGENFATAIEKSVSSCNALIAVIGPHWLNIEDEQGKRRLTKPRDYVRLEIAAALKNNIRIIPALVEGACMPGENDLPDDLVALGMCDVIELSHESFAYDVDRLVQSIGGAYGKVDVHLGTTYQSLVRTRMMNPINIFEVQIDQKKVGEIKGPELSFGKGQSPDKPWKSLLLRVEAGVHELSVVYRRSEFDTGTKSNEVSFQLKGGQTIQFMVEREASSVGHAKIIVKPKKSFVEL